MIDLSVTLGGLKLSTPVVTASGTFGYGTEYLGALDYTKLGAITVKGIRQQSWPGNPMPRHVEVFGGLVNAIGLQGPGIEDFVQHYVPNYVDTISESCSSVPPMIVNIWGSSVEEYAAVASKLDTVGFPVAAIEMNVSCPNVKEGGHTFGQDSAVLARVVAAVRAVTKLPLIVKLAPNVPDFAPYVQACEQAGADGLSLINTVPAMVIDVVTRKPVLGNRTGGLSGHAIHPIAVKAVYDVHRITKLPILAMGGVYTANDAIELMLVGASAVAIGTATFTYPNTASEVCDGIADYCVQQGFTAVREITGALKI